MSHAVQYRRTSKDFAFRDKERARFEQIFPRHKTVLLPEASHFLQEDAGEDIAQAFTVFCKELG
jgi:hypothetical protein